VRYNLRPLHFKIVCPDEPRVGLHGDIALPCNNPFDPRFSTQQCRCKGPPDTSSKNLYIITAGIAVAGPSVKLVN